MKNKFKVAVNKELSLNNVDDVIICALEGGSNYWSIVDNNVKVPEKYVRNKTIHYEFLDKVYQGSSADIYDAENPDEKLGTLDVNSIEKGLSLLGENYGHILNTIIDETYDAFDADIFFQLCILGEVVYG